MMAVGLVAGLCFAAGVGEAGGWDAFWPTVGFGASMGLFGIAVGQIEREGDR